MEALAHCDIERIGVEVMLAHSCHTVILYGSRARGEASETSDIDLLCVRRDGPDVRDARIVDGVYVDAFVYSESTLEKLDAGLLRVLGGRVLREEAGFGTTLIAKLQALHERGPEPLTDDARNAIVLWSGKMLERFREQDGLEANYR